MREQAYDEYQQGWSSILKAARDAIDSGDTSLARVLAKLGAQAGASSDTRQLERYGMRVCGQRVPIMPVDASYQHVVFRAMVLHEISRRLDADTVNIVELGSGYSNNLFELWLGGAPRDANYFGLEYTAAGRECAGLLAALEPRIKYQAHAFDYYKPVLPAFDRNAKTFAFSCYSIEQITTLGREVFDALLAVPGLYQVVHLEPVGWQAGIKLAPFPSELQLWKHNRDSALKHEYNTNLISLLRSMEAAGKINIDRLEVDFLAHRPDLPGTSITWSPRR